MFYCHVYVVGCTCPYMCLIYFVCYFCFLCVCLVFLFFFFSSRRRHTRCLSDWSSDVCSSDLLLERVGWRAELGRRSFTDVMLLHNHVLPRLLMNGDHARQLPDQQQRNSA